MKREAKWNIINSANSQSGFPNPSIPLLSPSAYTLVRFLLVLLTLAQMQPIYHHAPLFPPAWMQSTRPPLSLESSSLLLPSLVMLGGLFACLLVRFNQMPPMSCRVNHASFVFFPAPRRPVHPVRSPCCPCGTPSLAARLGSQIVLPCRLMTGLVHLFSVLHKAPPGLTDPTTGGCRTWTGTTN